MDEFEEEANWTVEQWRFVTRSWSEVNKVLAKAALEQPYEERMKTVAPMRKLASKSKDDWTEFAARLWRLPEPVLKRVVESFK